jgi:hypothetical protein
MTGATREWHIKSSNGERPVAADNPHSGKAHAEGGLDLLDLLDKDVDSSFTYKIENI